MIQAIIRKGKVLGEEIPSPNVTDGSVLIKVVNSCISAGTEMSGVTNSGKNLIRRALDQPENVKKVISMARSLGISKTMKKIRGQLDSGNPTGYSLSGVVIGIGKGVNSFKIGDRVAAAGSGIANHAEFVDVPVNLVMHIPAELGFAESSTVTLGGIAFQGVRRLDASIGEFVVVVGAGILGLLSIQMLIASGIRVIVTDLDGKRLEIAAKLGCELIIHPKDEDIVKTVLNYTGGHGADAVLFTAATSSNEPLSQSFQMCRKKGKVVLVGVAGMNINRADIYKKELDFLMSTSYGPGRYDPTYEEKGIDYPYAYVRWTENRNMTEYLRLLSIGHVNLDMLINGEYPIEKVTEAYSALAETDNRPLMVLLSYGKGELDNIEQYLSKGKKFIIKHSAKGDSKIINVALIGCGGFATSMHLPNIEKLSPKYRLYATMSRTGHKAKAVAVQFGADYATTDYEEILRDPQVDLVLIATGHDSHASLALRALEAGKHVFVEKPLAVNLNELQSIEAFYNHDSSTEKPVLMPAFNRRFSPYAQEIKKHTLKRINPLFMRYRMNAGHIPPDHHLHEHGGRMVGEACHIIDLMTFFTESEVVSISVESLSPNTDYFIESDNKSITLKYKDGSLATIEYFAVGSKEMPKEQLEMHFDGKSIVMDDYKNLKGYGITIKELSNQASVKGHFEELQAMYDTLSGQSEKWPIELWDMLQTTMLALEI